MIWLLGALLALLAAAALALPWWRPGFAAPARLRPRSANVAAYRTRLAELAAENAAGVLPGDAVEAARTELGARLLADMPPAEPLAAPPASTHALRAMVLASCGLAVFAGAWYFAAGSWRTQALVSLHARDPAAANHAALARWIDELQAQVAAHPDDADAWSALGQALRAADDPAAAAAAFAAASRLHSGQDADLLVAEAEAVLQTPAGMGPAKQRLAQALALAPDHPRGLWYAGLVALHAEDPRMALQHWERLARQELPEPVRATLAAQLADVRARLGVAAPVAVRLPVRVKLAPALAEAARGAGTLFVVAQLPEGSRAPLAVRRFPEPVLPLATELDDSHAMLPSRRLSGEPRWKIVARLSRSGNAQPQAGDLQGTAEVAREDAGQGVTIIIDRQL